MAVSDSSSNPGAYGYHPGLNSGHPSEPLSGDTLNGPVSPIEGAAAAGAAGGLAAEQRKNNSNIHRGTSNASSAYSSGRAISDVSDEPAPMPGPYHHEEVPYNIYSEAQPRHGPYGDGSYGAGRGEGQPVIQNVGARRDTRIERVPTFPQQAGNPTIAQNF